ncbi:MAG: hypothetical protein HKM04_08490 [Legionellales bacterium]|nr:hypothetical protein [Legionellales bacterium]
MATQAQKNRILVQNGSNGCYDGVDISNIIEAGRVSGKKGVILDFGFSPDDAKRNIREDTRLVYRTINMEYLSSGFALRLENGFRATKGLPPLIKGEKLTREFEGV